MSIKFFVQIIRFQREHRRNWNEEKWNQLLLRQAQEYKCKAIKLEGLLIKLGQFLATRADILPEVFLKELADLMDHVPPVAWKETKRVIEKELGEDLEAIFASISTDPVASASIGQVHKATLLTGEQVAVKVQRPTISKVINADLRALSIVMFLAGRFTFIGQAMDTKRLFQEIKQVITAELDFKQELANGVYFGEKYESFKEVHIPSFYQELTTKKILVMEWIDGKSVTNQALIAELPYSKEQLAKYLLSIFLEQLLREGLFHADPHPGNIMLKEDGTIVLIDFGMVATIKKKDSQELQKLVEALVLSDYSQVVDSLEQLRFLLPHADKQQLERMIRQFVDVALSANLTGWEEDVMQGLLADFRLLLRDLPVQMPSEFAFLGRAVSTLTGVLYSIDPKLDLFELGKPIVLDWLRDNETEGRSSFLDPKRWLEQVSKTLISLPNKLDALANEPRLYREQQERQYQERKKQQYSLWSRHYAFLLFLTGVISSLMALYLEHSPLLIGSSIVLSIGLLSLLITSKSIRP